MDQRGLDWFCYFVIALAVAYFGIVLIAHWWPNLRGLLVAMNGM